MDRSPAPIDEYFGTVSADDWAAFTEGYADLIEDLDGEPSDVPGPRAVGHAAGRAAGARTTDPLPRRQVRSRRLAIAT